MGSATADFRSRMEIRVNRILVTAATGVTGSATVKALVEKGHSVRAMARSDDERSKKLVSLGAEVVFGDMRNLNDMRRITEGVSTAYFCYPMASGLVEAAAVFVQAAKENELELIVNMSHKQSRPQARSQATLKHWLTEQMFDQSGIPATHLRVTFFAEWILYIAHLIRQGRYVTPFDADSRFAPIAGSDLGLIIAGILLDPQKHAGKIYPLHGPVEYSHEELAALVGRRLGKELRFENVSVDTFLELLGIPNDVERRDHFLSVTIDQREERLRGLDETGTLIIGRPLMTMEQFVSKHRAILI
jgi:NAD(P)H dehydrogenase (quinone)